MRYKLRYGDKYDADRVGKCPYIHFKTQQSERLSNDILLSSQSNLLPHNTDFRNWHMHGFASPVWQTNTIRENRNVREQSEWGDTWAS
jgi:hypothetical protein